MVTYANSRMRTTEQLLCEIDRKKSRQTLPPLTCLRCGIGLELRNMNRLPDFHANGGECFLPAGYDIEHLGTPCEWWRDRKGGGIYTCYDPDLAYAHFDARAPRPRTTPKPHQVTLDPMRSIPRGFIGVKVGP